MQQDSMLTVSHKYLSFGFLFQRYSQANFEKIDMGGR